MNFRQTLFGSRVVARVVIDIRLSSLFVGSLSPSGYERCLVQALNRYRTLFAPARKSRLSRVHQSRPPRGVILGIEGTTRRTKRHDGQ
jgi:hypothetical protein